MRFLSTRSLVSVVITSALVISLSVPVSPCLSQETGQATDTILPVWWMGFRDQGQARGVFTGRGTKKNKDLGLADAAALEAAEGDLRNWLFRPLNSVSLWYVQSYARDLDVTALQAMRDMVAGLVEEYVQECRRSRGEQFAQSDGLTAAYVLVEVDGRPIPSRMARMLVKEISDVEPSEFPDRVAEVETRLKAALGLSPKDDQPKGSQLSPTTPPEASEAATAPVNLSPGPRDATTQMPDQGGSWVKKAFLGVGVLAAVALAVVIPKEEEDPPPPGGTGRPELPAPPDLQR